MFDEVFILKSSQLNPYLSKIDDEISDQMPWLEPLLICVVLEMAQRQRNVVRLFRNPFSKFPSLNLESIDISFRIICNEVCQIGFNIVKDLYWYNQRFRHEGSKPNEDTYNIRTVLKIINELIDSEKSLPITIPNGKSFDQYLSDLTDKLAVKELKAHSNLLKKPLLFAKTPLQAFIKLIGIIGLDLTLSAESLRQLNHTKSFIKHLSTATSTDSLNDLKKKLHVEINWLAERQPQVALALSEHLVKIASNKPGATNTPQARPSVPSQFTPVELAFWSVQHSQPHLLALLFGDSQLAYHHLQRKNSELQQAAELNRVLYNFSSQLVFFLSHIEGGKITLPLSHKSAVTLIEEYQKFITSNKLNQNMQMIPESNYWDSNEITTTLIIRRELLMVLSKILEDTCLSKSICALKQNKNNLALELNDIKSRDRSITRDLATFDNKYRQCFSYDEKTTSELMQRYKKAFVDINSTNEKGETLMQVAIRSNDLNIIFYLIEVAERQGIILIAFNNNHITNASDELILTDCLDPKRQVSYYQKAFYSVLIEYHKQWNSSVQSLKGFNAFFFRIMYNETILLKERREELMQIYDLIRSAQENNNDSILDVGIRALLLKMNRGATKGSRLAKALENVFSDGIRDSQPFIGNYEGAKIAVMQRQHDKEMKKSMLANQLLQLQNLELVRDKNKLKSKSMTITHQLDDNIKKMEIMANTFRQKSESVAEVSTISSASSSNTSSSFSPEFFGSKPIDIPRRQKNDKPDDNIFEIPGKRFK